MSLSQASRVRLPLSCVELQKNLGRTTDPPSPLKIFFFYHCHLKLSLTRDKLKRTNKALSLVRINSSLIAGHYSTLSLSLCNNDNDTRQNINSISLIRINFILPVLIFTVLCHCTIPKEINFPRCKVKCSGENEILYGIFHVVEERTHRAQSC